jgi:hypothetical protein
MYICLGFQKVLKKRKIIWRVFGRREGAVSNKIVPVKEIALVAVVALLLVALLLLLLRLLRLVSPYRLQLTLHLVLTKN